jgi:hypothetical protein
MEAIIEIRRVAGEYERDFNRWLVEADSPRVRECLLALELADLLKRERGE